jgi:aldose 1-epimerase
MMNRLFKSTLGLGVWLCLGVAAQAAVADKITHRPFGKTKEGQAVELYTLQNANGCQAKITNYGGIVTSLTMPDNRGRLEDVVLGFDKLEGYLSPEYKEASPYFGALIGRYGNRIGKGKFTLDGKEYQLPVNNNGNTLHGGPQGFNQRVWEAKEVKGHGGPALELSYISKDGEEGFPGTLKVTAVYTLTDKNELKLEIKATTDKTTIVNLTHHSYFNLKGAGKGDILDHEIMLNAEKFVPIDAVSIPLGELKAVKGTAFDFTKPAKIGARIEENDEQLKNAKGYDHTFVIDGYTPGGNPRLIACVTEATTGRVLEVESTEPGVQFYTANFLDGSLTGKGNIAYQKRFAFCLEPQHYPDAPNHPDYPSTTLKPGETYHNTIIYRFSVKK